MADDHETEEPDVQPAVPAGERSTAPQSAYTSREVGVGIGVLVVGLVLTYGLALVL